MKKTGDYKIPFRDGNQMEYEFNYYKDGKLNSPILVDNFEFEDELEFIDYGRGRSSVTFTFERLSNAKTVSMFVSDFSGAIPHMINGKLKGKFTFVKKGQNYGCRMILE